MLTGAEGNTSSAPHTRWLAFRARWRTLGFLGFLQIAAMAALVTILIAVALIMRHQTESYFVPVDKYVLSLKLAIPPAIVLVGSYVIGLLTGTPVSDVPKAAFSFVRNRYFQSSWMMGGTLAVALVSVIVAGWLAYHVTPPEYDAFVRRILNVSAEDEEHVRERVAEIAKSNPGWAAKLSKVVEIFVERSAVNAGRRSLSGDRARGYVRILEAGSGSKDDPLLKHALAEAYSLLGQSISHAAGQIGGVSVANSEVATRKSISLYGEVVSSTSPLAPQALRMSAQMNMGNNYYYLREYEEALRAYRAANTFENGTPDMGPWGNIIAVLTMLDRPQEAVTEGENARQWAEVSGEALTATYAYAGILENLAYAKMQLDDIAGALENFAEANAFREDDLTRQNLALALIINGKPADAQRVMAQISPSLEVGAVAKSDVAACIYFIWGLALVDQSVPVRAANFYAFLGEKHAPDEMKNLSPEDFDVLLTRVAGALPKADLPCGSLGKINSITKLLIPSAQAEVR